jgi:membrane protein
MRRFFHFLFFLPEQLYIVFWREHLTQMAAALSFSTLLTLVPLVTLVLAVASYLSGFSAMVGQLDAWIMRALLPGQSGMVAQQIHALADSAHGLAWPWVLALTGMVLLLLHTLECAFNQIWGVKEGRPWLKRLPLYLVGLLGVPFLMGVLTSLFNLLANLALGWNHGLASYQQSIMNWLDFVLLTTFFSLLYYALPNARISRHAALCGGILVSLLLLAMKEGLRWYVTRTEFYSRLYGALSSLPIFLLWLYLMWMLVLAVAIVVACIDGTPGRFRPRS